MECVTKNPLFLDFTLLIPIDVYSGYKQGFLAVGYSCLKNASLESKTMSDEIAF